MIKYIFVIQTTGTVCKWEGGHSPVGEMQHLLITIGIDLSVASNVILLSGWCEANI
jgi:hypothetical protein